MSRKPRTLAQQVEYEFPAYGPFIRARLVRCILSERRRMVRRVRNYRASVIPIKSSFHRGIMTACDDILKALKDHL